MIILGVSGGHDANWCVCRDGDILGAYEKERFSRRRHDTGEVMSYVAATLTNLGLAPSDIDFLATSEPVARGQDAGHHVVSGRRYETLSDWQWQMARVFGRVVPCLSVPHHLAHASYARFTSAFEDTAVLTLDGGGDAFTVDAKAATTISLWKGARLEWIERVDNSDIGSLWFMYANAVFQNPNAAGKLMGLAALGSDRLVNAMRERVVRPVIAVLDGAATVKDCWSDYYQPPFLPSGRGWQDPLARDVAFAVQAVTSEAGVSLAATARDLVEVDNLALAGGVALNGYLTTRIARDAGFGKTHVPPSVHDGGISIGAALFAAHHELDVPFEPSRGRELAFLGVAYSERRVRHAIDQFGCDARRVDMHEAVDVAAASLARGEFVAWYEGRSEHGPRALGHRSILALPSRDTYREDLNRQVKFREPFRPVAPVVIDDEADRFFDLPHPSPYMMHIVEAREITRGVAPAAVHVDGTSRVQTVSRTSHLGEIASGVGHRTGTPVVINTSLNVNSPIAETPEEALAVFARSPLDLLVIDGYLVSKRGGAR